ncbi:hypothetical protein DITRI_Ditri07aG0047700 [Diplodiscus trichospermus]
MEVVLRGSFWSVGDGINIEVWQDKWVNIPPLYHLTISGIHPPTTLEYLGRGGLQNSVGCKVWPSIWQMQCTYNLSVQQVNEFQEMRMPNQAPTNHHSVSWIESDAGSIKINVDASYDVRRGSVQSRETQRNIWFCAVKDYNHVLSPSKPKSLAIVYGVEHAVSNAFWSLKVIP